MPKLLSDYATPFVSGLFLVSLVSGVALFFHVGPSGFHGMHEWLSIVLIAPFILHVWRNWRPMTIYFRHAPMAIATAISVLAAAVFLFPAQGGQEQGGPPQRQLLRQILKAPLSAAAPALGADAATLSTRLSAAGFVVESVDQPLAAIASASGKDERALAEALLGHAH